MLLSLPDFTYGPQESSIEGSGLVSTLDIRRMTNSFGRRLSGAMPTALGYAVSRPTFAACPREAVGRAPRSYAWLQSDRFTPGSCRQRNDWVDDFQCQLCLSANPWQPVCCAMGTIVPARKNRGKTGGPVAGPWPSERRSRGVGARSATRQLAAASLRFGLLCR